MLALAGCTDDPARPRAPASGNAAPTPSPAGAAAARELTARLLGADEEPPRVATVAGKLNVVDGLRPFAIDGLEVRAASRSTLLRWRFRSGTGARVHSYTDDLGMPNVFDTRQIALVDRTGRARLQPYTYVPQVGSQDTGCVCSKFPDEVGGTGASRYALNPPLAAGATTVDVVVPSFAVARAVPVVR